MTYRLLLVLVALTLPACGPAPGNPWVELGTGEWRFEPLADEQEVELVRGAQGGWHVWVSVRARELGPDDVRMEIDSKVVGSERDPATGGAEIDLQPTDEMGTYEFTGWPAVQPRPECVVDSRLRVRVALTSGGKTVSDERIVIPRVMDTDPPAGTCAQP
jgi:hypothetical protein